MNDQPIPRVQRNDYHGVTIPSNLSWKNQCEKVCNKAKRTLEPVKRTLQPADPSCSVWKTVYKMLVRPSMEYAMDLENVQKSAARFVCGYYRKKASVTETPTDSTGTSWLPANVGMQQ